TFAVGVVTVMCMATDAHHNTTAASFTVTTLGARGIVQSVLDGITALRQTVTNRTDQQSLDRIIDKLTSALDPSLWVDELHVDPKRGDRVFDRLKDAIQNLMDLQKDKNSAIPDAVLQGFIDDLVNANRLLAVISISDATDAGGDSRKLDKANDQVLKGDNNARDGQHDDAVGKYNDAWDRAQDSKR